MEWEIRADRIDTLVSNSPLAIGEIARRADVAPDYLWKLRRGKAPNASLVVMARLADVLEVDVYDFLGVDRTDQGLPIPAPELAEAVDKLNGLSQRQRKAMARLIVAQVELIEEYASPSSADPEIAQLVRLLDALPETVRQEFQRRIAEEAATLHAASQPRGNGAEPRAVSGSRKS